MEEILHLLYLEDINM